MTIDEAIKYYKGMSNFYKSEFNKGGAEKCSQLAEWLEELKDYRAEFIEARQKDYETDYAKGREDEEFTEIKKQIRAGAIDECKYNTELFREIFLEKLIKESVDMEEAMMYRNICTEAWSKYLEQLKGEG